MNVHFSSKAHDWETPDDLFDTLNKEFRFTLDVCANEHNHKVDKYFDEKIDGLSVPWTGTCFMNPPYGRDIWKWVKKACEEAFNDIGTTVVGLLPARTDTKWWHTYVLPYAYEIRYIRGRLKFKKDGKELQSAPFPSAVVVWNGRFGHHVSSIDRSGKLITKIK